jgi:hypothetical protein
MWLICSLSHFAYVMIKNMTNATIEYLFDIIEINYMC